MHQMCFTWITSNLGWIDKTLLQGTQKNYQQENNSRYTDKVGSRHSKYPATPGGGVSLANQHEAR